MALLEQSHPRGWNGPVNLTLGEQPCMFPSYSGSIGCPGSYRVLQFLQVTQILEGTLVPIGCISSYRLPQLLQGAHMKWIALFGHH
jgi:hypothetical protein